MAVSGVKNKYSTGYQCLYLLNNVYFVWYVNTYFKVYNDGELKVALKKMF